MSLTAAFGITTVLAGAALQAATSADLLAAALEVGGALVVGYELGICASGPAASALRTRICGFVPGLKRFIGARTPLYDAEGSLVGEFAVQPAASGEQPRAAYWAGPARFRALFDNFPFGYALCRFGTPLESGRDFWVEEANRALISLLGLNTAKVAQPISTLFPALVRTRPELFELVAKLPEKGSDTYTAWFAYWGMYIEHRFVWLGDGYFAWAVRDVTDSRLHQAEVLKLHGQMGHALSSQTTRLEMLTRTTDRFLQNAAAHLEGPVDALSTLFADHEESSISQAGLTQLAIIHDLLRVMLRYSHAAALNYRPELVSIAGIADEVLAIIQPRYPHITFRVGPRPMTTSSASVLHAVLLGLLDPLCRVAGRDSGTSIEIGVSSEFLEARYYAKVLNPKPVTMSDCESGGYALDDTYAALQMSVCRRLVYYHGGTMTLTQEEDGSLLVSVTMGEPLTMLSQGKQAT